MFIQDMDSPSVFIITIDDVSNEFLNAYGEGPPEKQPATPNMDRIAEMGMLFDNFWSMPMCSPTRACVMTGRWPNRYGIGDVILSDSTKFLPLAEVTIAEVDNTKLFAHIGKWHLGKRWLGYDPILQGFDIRAGTHGNVPDYSNWIRQVAFQGFLQETQQTQYVTQQNTDAALMLFSMLTNSRPFCINVNYHSAHKPLHDPPGYNSDGTDLGKYRAMIEYMDNEIGRILSGYDPMMDYLVLYSDNGSIPEVSSYDKSKGDVREAGINVPLIVVGPGISAGTRSSSLASCADLHKTVLDMMGINSALSPAAESVSLMPVLHDPSAVVRSTNYSERFSDQDGDGKLDVDLRAARDAQYKLIWEDAGNVLIFTDILNAPPGEEGQVLNTTNLTQAQQASYDVLFATVQARGR